MRKLALRDIKKTPAIVAIKWAAACATALAMCVAVPVHAEEMELPSAAEVQYFSPEAQQFYAAGVAALNTADYKNAYSLLSKAAALQPAAINLNHIVAKLAAYMGRQSSAEEARDYYETSINSYESILRVQTISADLRRQVTNELKLSIQERDNLAQRDVLREATGTAFLLDWNRKYASRPKRQAGAPPAPTPATTLTQQMVTPPMQGGYPAQPGVYPGMPGMAPGMPGMAPGMPGMAPGMPGAYPQQPGAYPQQPGAYPQQPGQPLV